MNKRKRIFLTFGAFTLAFCAVLATKANKKFTSSIATLFYKDAGGTLRTIVVGGTDNTQFTTVSTGSNHLAKITGSLSYQMYGSKTSGGTANAVYVSF